MDERERIERLETALGAIGELAKDATWALLDHNVLLVAALLNKMQEILTEVLT